MKSIIIKTTTILFIGSWTMIPGAFAERIVSVTAEVAAEAREAAHVAGDIIPVTLYVSGAESAALFGVEFEISVPEALRIRDIEFDPAFSNVMRGPEPTLPASRFKSTRTQPPGQLNRSLGADGRPVAFATVEIEVLSALFAEADIVVTARGSLLGQPPTRTAVSVPNGDESASTDGSSDDAGGASGNDASDGSGAPPPAVPQVATTTLTVAGQKGTSRVKLVNTLHARSETAPAATTPDGSAPGTDGASPPGEDPTGAPDEGTAAAPPAPGLPAGAAPIVAIAGSVTIEIRELGGQSAVTHPVAGRSYELHYAASHPVDSYVLFTIGATPHEGLADVHRPAVGPWANDGAYFAGILKSGDHAVDSATGRPAPAPGYPEGMHRYDQVLDLANLVAGTPAPATGHLLSFVPESPGQLRLELHMTGYDASQQAAVEMSTKAVLAVAEAD